MSGGMMIPGQTMPFNPTATFPTFQEEDPQRQAFSQQRSASVILSRLKELAIFLWLVTPLYTFVLAVVPALQPTCERGLANWTYLYLVPLLGCYAATEVRAWSAAKGLITEPEQLVLRSFGVLSLRKWQFLFGVIEMLNWYNDLTFPILSFHCGSSLTDKWVEDVSDQWGSHSFAIHLLQVLRMWRISAFCTAISLGEGLRAMYSLFTFDFSQEWSQTYSLVSSAEMDGRMPAGDCLELALVAEHAGVPSVSRLCQEVGWQRRYHFDPKESLGGARGYAKAREDVVFGWQKKEALRDHELRDRRTAEKVEAATLKNLYSFLIRKILLQNVLQLWIQVVFFQLAFPHMSSETKGKFVFRIGVSLVYIVARMALKVSRCEFGIALICIFALVVAAWACAKASFTFECASHQWHLISGCEAVEGSSTSSG